MKDASEIVAEHQRNSTGLLIGYEDAKKDIRERMELKESGAYVDRLSDEERRRILLEEKRAAAQETYEQTLEAYRNEIARFRGEVEERREFLQERLFKVEDADAVARCALASDQDLEGLMDRAMHAQNPELARAVFSEVALRGGGDVMARFFDHVDGEARGFYSELHELPSEEGIELQLENTERIVRPIEEDRLMPNAKASSY